MNLDNIWSNLKPTSRPMAERWFGPMMRKRWHTNSRSRKPKVRDRWWRRKDGHRQEIHLNEFLEHNGIESVETDLGEYIQQPRRKRSTLSHRYTGQCIKARTMWANYFTKNSAPLLDRQHKNSTLVARENCGRNMQKRVSADEFYFTGYRRRPNGKQKATATEHVVSQNAYCGGVGEKIADRR